MDFKIRGIELVKCALTRQHTAFQPRDSAGLYLIHQRFKIPFQKSEPLRTQQNPNTPLNVPKQAADFVSYHKICCLFFFKCPFHCRDPPPSSESHQIQPKWRNNLVEAKHEETYSPEYQRQVRYQFESFCRKVIHSERCDYLRRMLRHMEYETNFSALPEGCLNSVDRVESNVECPYIFNVCGYSIPIQDDRLASALHVIKLSDRAVGELLKLSRSRVWRMKSKLLSALREKMKE